MSLRAYLETLHRCRGPREVIIPTMGAAREWMRLGTHPLDLIYAPSAMGQAPSLGLGLALARPDLQVTVLNGDGCQWMNLGCLLTIASCQPTNLRLVICDNGSFEVTGGQRTAASGQPIDWRQIAHGCGWGRVHEFDTPVEWDTTWKELGQLPGPRLVVWRYAPDPSGTVPKSPAPPAGRVRQLAEHLRALPVANCWA
ncbi:MAG: thiamine pyrophosphate-dependent enzyme [Planctomycetaceae bacterium]